jgi:hypothetical protein
VFHWRYTSAGGVNEDIISPVVSVSLEIYFCRRSHRGYHPPLVESSKIRPVGSVSMEIFLCWWSHRGYLRPVVNLRQQKYISSESLTTGLMISSVTPPAEVYLQLNTDYWAVKSPRISSSAGGVIEDPPSSQCFTAYIPLLVESPRISSAQ